jgi:YggT family protein
MHLPRDRGFAQNRYNPRNFGKPRTMFSQALHFVLTAVLNLFLLALLLRFYLQAVRAPYGNPVSQFVIALTDFAVRPLRRVVPGIRGLDLATLLLAWLTALLLLVISLALGPSGPFGASFALFPALALWAAVYVLRWSIYILMGALIVQVILSWVNPYSPIAPLLDSMTRPFLRPVRRRLPSIGNVDLSPLVVLLACQLLLITLVAWLESLALRVA